MGGEQTTGTPAIERDLYCLSCGYNLRGLSGDPVRCPECGSLNAVAELGVPAGIVSPRLRQLEKVASDVSVGVMAVVPLQLLFWGVVAGALARRLGHLGCVAVTGALAFGMLALWLAGTLRFRRLCCAQPGWLAALLAYCGWALLQLVATFAAVFAWGIAVATVLWRPYANWAGVTAGIVLLVAAIALLAIFVCWSNRRARARLSRLLRSFAITLIREERAKGKTG